MMFFGWIITAPNVQYTNNEETFWGTNENVLIYELWQTNLVNEVHLKMTEIKSLNCPVNI